MKRLQILFVAAFITCSLLTYGREVKYPVSEIPPALLNNADFVVRLDETSFQIISLNYTVLQYHKVITILKESALPRAMLVQFYDKNNEINYLEGSIYNADGIFIKKFQNKDIFDESAIQDGILYSDDRVKYIRPLSVSYPFTVEYYVQVVSKKILNYPFWCPVYSYRQSVISTSFKIITAEGLFPRMKKLNLPSGIIICGDTLTELRMELKNLEAVEYEPLCPSLKSRMPLVMLAPSEYKAKGYEGDFSTWKGVGLWISSLNEGRDSLNEKNTEKIRTVSEQEKDEKTRLKKVYQFMQKTCRYVSTNEGIGGWQPETADKVAKFGYGDCKALVNYTKALLVSSGISSIYTVVKAGENDPIYVDFPTNQFNHVILCVPLRSDTIWLECTDQSQPFGFLGSFTDDREVLMITEEGGKLTRTPSYPKKVNTLNSRTVISIDSAGNASVTKTSCYKGLQFEDVEKFLPLPAEKLKEKVTESLDIPGLSLKTVKVHSEGDIIPSGYLDFSAYVRNYASVSGGRIFIPVNTFLDEPGLQKKDPERKCDFILKIPYIDYDTVILNLPTGYTLEALPEPSTVKTPYGVLESRFIQESGTIRFIRRFEREKGRFPASLFNEYVAFLHQVVKQDKIKVVLRH